MRTRLSLICMGYALLDLAALAVSERRIQQLELRNTMAHGRCPTFPVPAYVTFEVAGVALVAGAEKNARRSGWSGGRSGCT
jgi:hypothetical protein